VTPQTLRQWRQDRNLTRKEAAEVLGINERTLEGMEKARYSASPLWGVLGKLVPLLDATPRNTRPT
jgi:DNA-binding XRE family transcriptional regulator